MKRAAKEMGKEALDLIEEAAHVLRTAPIATLAVYYLGALPFVLGGLYFWADMSRSPYAAQHLAGATLGMAGLFVWMKFWQTLFARRVRAFIARETLPPFRWRRCGHVLLTQMALQPTGLFLLPLASVPVLPTGWVYAFYQNLTVLDDGESGELRPLLRKARRQAALQPKENHLLLALLLGFGFCVFLNWGMVCFALPGLLKMLFGVETIFTRANLHMLNTTFFATIFGLTYLCVDPLAKAAYALRCFYGESVRSGEDLKSGLREFAGAAQVAAVAVLIAIGATGVCWGAEAPGPAVRSVWSACGLAPLSKDLGLEKRQQAARTPNASSATNAPDVTERHNYLLALVEQPASEKSVGDVGQAERRVGERSASISAPKLDATIERVIQENKYAWRAPREKGLSSEDADEGVIARFLSRVWDLMKGWMKDVFHGLGKCLEWLGKWLGKLLGRFFRFPAPSTPGYGWIMSLNLLLYVLLAAVLLGLLYLAYRIWQNRRPKAEVIASEAILPVPDVADENVGADQLPEAGWMKLGRELLGRGELRLALRAFYLASLAHLAERNLISIAKSKSNREYERELLRRGHAFPELLTVFGENVTVFDRIWYGLHEVNLELVNEFAGRVEQIQGVGMEGRPQPAGAGGRA